MLSSRMRTTCLLPVSPRMHRSQRVYLPGGYYQGACTCTGGVYLPGGVPAQGVPTQVPPRRYTHSCEKNDRQVQKYYLAPNFVCGR